VNEIVRDARAFLRRFELVDYGDMLIRNGGFSLFIARESGGANPLRAPAASAEAPSPAVEHVVHAPHLGTFRSALTPGSRVGENGRVATIELLGEAVEVRTDRPGTVSAVLPQAGELVEYGAPLVRLSC
jgi:biotin carboxyl carrier protein